MRIVEWGLIKQLSAHFRVHCCRHNHCHYSICTVLQIVEDLVEPKSCAEWWVVWKAYELEIHITQTQIEKKWKSVPNRWLDQPKK